MKLTKTSRVTAMILALLMIVPLISVPTFAEDAATYTPSETIVTESFENETVHSALSSYVKLDGVSIVNGSATGKNVSDKVLKIKVDCPDGEADDYGPMDDGTLLPGDRLTYTVGAYDADKIEKVVVLQEDVYIPSTTTSFKLVCQIKNVTFTESDTTNTNWCDLWNYRIASGALYLQTPAVSNNDKADADIVSSMATVDASYQIQTKKGVFSFDTWYTMTTVINLDTGLVTLYANGVKMYAYHLYHNMAKAACEKFTIHGISPVKIVEGTAWEGDVYVDNLGLYTYDDGYVPSTDVATPALYSAEYDSATTNGVTAKLGTETLYTLENGFLNVDGAKTPLTADAANTVKIVLGTLASGKLTADIYLNGVYAGTRDLAATTVGDWNLGTTVTTGTYDATALKETALAEDVIYVTYNEVNYPNIANVFRTYGLTDPEYTTTTAAEYFAEHALINTLEQSSIRATEPTGLRFATSVNTAEIDALAALGVTVTGAGTLISPKDFVDVYGDLSLEDEDYVVGTTILKVAAGAACLDGVVDNDADTTHFVGSIVEILADNINRAFSGCGYITVKLANGTEINLYSGTTYSISVAEQAYKTLNSEGYGETSPGYDVVKAYADQYVPTTSAE